MSSRERRRRPGLAEERTELAWSRTSLAAAVAAAAIVKRLWEQFETTPARAVVFSILAVGGLAWSAAAWWGHVTARRGLVGRRVPGPAELRRVTLGTVVFAAIALVLAATAR